SLQLWKALMVISKRKKGSSRYIVLILNIKGR
ncbi:MAG: hypothetical protein ACI81W_003539, partial [Saprospiraceae bacterium]